MPSIKIESMRQRNFFLCLMLAFVGLSCIREEAPNAEADILSCTVPGDILITEPEITNESVTMTVRGDADISQLAPEFTLTPGATISPASGTSFDFSSPRTYTVTSEDGNWTKTYTVRCILSGVSQQYHFENVALEPTNGRYHIFYDYTSSGDSVAWASANAGYALTGVPVSPTDYPTMQCDSGYVGKCAKLVTRSTGAFGSMLGMPLASGNLFIGTFDVQNALPDGRRGMRMGRPCTYVPAYVSGYYKYKAGETYEKDGEVVAGRTDQCDIYAIFYETSDEVSYLDGFNYLTSPNLISVARISDQRETDEWTHFYIPFIARAGKVIDKEKLARGGYNLAIVFASSIHGDTYEGAVGSTLYVDEVQVIQSNE